MQPLRDQRRGRSIAMTGEEVDDFLRVEHTCRVATVGGNGQPHVAPLWFIWDGAALWLSSLVRSQRWTDPTPQPRATALCPDLAEPERLFARKYGGTGEFTPDGRHGWLRIRPEKLTSWDFRKNPALRSAAP